MSPSSSENTPLLRDLPPEPIAPNDPAQSSAYGTKNLSNDVEAPSSSIPEDTKLPPASTARAQLPYIFPALAIGVFLAAADQTIIVSSYGRIGSDLDALSETSWIATAYFLTLTSIQPLYGKMSDIFGRKACLLFAYITFGLGCLFCGLARNINQLIAARAFAGIGGGGMTTVVSILLSDVVTLRERGTWQGYVNIVYATGAGCGAPLGGLLADSIGWRWAFLGQVPLCVLAFFAVLFALKLPSKDSSDWRTKLRRVDFLGAITLILAVFALLFGMDRGSNVSWRVKECLIPLCLSLPLFGAFVLVEMKVAAEPFAPGHIIFNRTLFASYLCNFFSFGGWLAALFFLPLYWQAVDGKTASIAGAYLIPCIVAGVSGSLLGGIYMQKTGKYYWITVVAYSGLTLGLLGVTLLSGVVAKSTIGIIICSCIASFSNGIGVTTTLIALISNASQEDQAVATACSYLFRSLGSTIGVSLTSTAANQTMRTALVKRLQSGAEADHIIENVRRSLSYIKTLEPATREIVRQCYMLSTRAAFILDTCIVLGAAGSAWMIREKSLSR
jgi:predicted MFS family arabinose efflux permease